MQRSGTLTDTTKSLIIISMKENLIIQHTKKHRLTTRKSDEYYCKKQNTPILYKI
jgi:hypothetical protein